MARKWEQGETSLVMVGKGLVVRGEFSGEGDLRVGGQLEGTIDLTGTVEIVDGATVQGEISATEITVAGTVRGNLTASGKVEVLATGQVIGDVRGSGVIIQEGAVVNGRISMETIPRSPGESAELAELTK